MTDNVNNNLLYNIINNSEPNILFNYSIIIVISLLLFKQLDFTYNIIFSLFIGSSIVYYLYTYKSLYDITKETKISEKYNLINTKKSVLKNHVKFTNIIFYMDDLKPLNIQLFDKIVSQIESFCNTFESCMTDFKLIDILYPTLIQLKINILISINNLSLSLHHELMQKKIDRVRNELENILNDYLKIIIGNHRKNIYYNGYNNGSKIIYDTAVLPINSFNVHDYKINNFNFSNLEFLT